LGKLDVDMMKKIFHGYHSSEKKNGLTIRTGGNIINEYVFDVF
jgi:hypothetical protein